MKPYHIAGNLLFLSGHVPQRGGTIIYPGRLGAGLTLEKGREAARLTGLNVIAGIKQAVGDLDRVKSIVRSLNFVVCTPDFTEVHHVRAASPTSSPRCSAPSAASAAERRSASWRWPAAIASRPGSRSSCARSSARRNSCSRCACSLRAAGAAATVMAMGRLDPSDDK